jgi:phosphoenolpyruvate-protein kinase (PTS system EI component)
MSRKNKLNFSKEDLENTGMINVVELQQKNSNTKQVLNEVEKQLENIVEEEKNRLLYSQNLLQNRYFSLSDSESTYSQQEKDLLVQTLASKQKVISKLSTDLNQTANLIQMKEKSIKERNLDIEKMQKKMCVVYNFFVILF